MELNVTITSFASQLEEMNSSQCGGNGREPPIYLEIEIQPASWESEMGDEQRDIKSVVNTISLIVLTLIRLAIESIQYRRAITH